jgi:hypothetical protein
MTPSAELRDRVLRAAASQPSPTRSQVRLRNLALLVSGLIVPLLVFHAWGGMRPTGRPQELILETAGGAAIVAGTVLVVVLGRGRSMLGRPGMWLLAAALATPVALFAWKFGVSSLHPGMTVEWPERVGFRCLRLSCLMAAWPLVALVMTRRGSDPTHPRLTGAAIGAAVGACVWVLVDLWCPVAYVPHLVLGHLLPFTLTTLMGFWLGGAAIALRGK